MSVALTVIFVCAIPSQPGFVMVGLMLGDWFIAALTSVFLGLFLASMEVVLGKARDVSGWHRTLIAGGVFVCTSATLVFVTTLWLADFLPSWLLFSCLAMIVVGILVSGITAITILARKQSI